jgi:hypothetical protein
MMAAAGGRGLLLRLLLAAVPAAAGGSGPLLRSSWAADGRGAGRESSAAALGRGLGGTGSGRGLWGAPRRLDALGDAVQGCTQTGNSYPAWSSIPGAQGWETLLCGDWFTAADGNRYQACYLSCE